MARPWPYPDWLRGDGLLTSTLVDLTAPLARAYLGQGVVKAVKVDPQNPKPYTVNPQPSPDLELRPKVGFIKQRQGGAPDHVAIFVEVQAVSGQIRAKVTVPGGK